MDFSDRDIVKIIADNNFSSYGKLYNYFHAAVNRVDVKNALNRVMPKDKSN